MTTVLFCAETKQIAVDSRITERSRIVTDNGEKYIAKDGFLFFISGSNCDFDNIIRAYFNPPTKWTGFPFAALVVNVEEETVKCIYQFDGKVLVDSTLYDEAIGSGAEFALAALDFTDSISQAMEYVKTKDSATGGKVRIYNISQRNFVVE